MKPTAHPGQAPTTSRAVVFAAGVVATIALALASVDALLAVFGPVSVQQAASVSGAVRSRQIDGDPAILVSTPLFGEEVVEEDVAFDTEALPTTTLRLKLIGPAASVSGDAIESALIALPDGRQERIRVDEEIIPGVVLKQVKRTQVIISRNGNAETLSLSRPLSARELRARTLSDDAPNEGTAQSGDASPDVVRDANARPPAPKAYTVSQLTGEVPELGPIFESQGFQGGDRIIAIDGKDPPTDENELRDAFASWITTSSLTITVQRGGSIINHRVELSEMSNL